MFGRVGYADSKVNQFDSYFGGGLVYTGLFSEEDMAGVSVAAVHNGSEFRKAQLNEGTKADKSEIVVELTYNTSITSWLAVQPDFQYVINPGMDPGLDDALVFNTRFEVSF